MAQFSRFHINPPDLYSGVQERSKDERALPHAVSKQEQLLTGLHLVTWCWFHNEIFQSQILKNQLIIMGPKTKQKTNQSQRLKTVIGKINFLKIKNDKMWAGGRFGAIVWICDTGAMFGACQWKWQLECGRVKWGWWFECVFDHVSQGSEFRPIVWIQVAGVQFGVTQLGGVERQVKWGA